MTRLCMLAIAAVAAMRGLGCHRAEGPRMLDAFDDLTPWRATASDGVTSSVRTVPGVRGAAMQLAFDLGGTAAPSRPRSARRLRADVSAARRPAGQQPRAQADRRQRRERLVVPPRQLRLPHGVARDPREALADRVCVSSGERR